MQISSCNSYDFSVIFVNYRSAAELVKAIISLPTGINRKIEIIVVNNDPEESKVLLALKKKLDFIFIDNKTNLGFGAAANQGANSASGTHLFFLNPDIKWRNGYWSDLDKAFEADPTVAIVGATIITEKGNREDWSFGKFPTLFELFVNQWLKFLRQIQKNKKRTGNRLDTDWVSGAALSVEKKVFDAIGGFDKDLFLYFEDVDICLRVKNLNKKIIISSQVIIEHRGGVSHQSVKEQKKNFFQSRLRYFKKHRRQAEYAILNWFQICWKNWR